MKRLALLLPLFDASMQVNAGVEEAIYRNLK
jgi:hypothetical protein